jgi:CBS domain-containing protein
MAHIPTAREARTRFKVTLSPDGNLLEAIERIVRRRSLGAPVLDGGGKVLGVLTEKDCLRISTQRTRRELREERVADHMSTLKATIHPEMNLFAIANLFLEGNFPVLPLVEKGRLAGRIGRWGLLRHIADLGREIERESRQMHRDLEAREDPRSIENLQRVAGSHSPEQLREVLHGRNR